jgi:hypothetical protein
MMKVVALILVGMVCQGHAWFFGQDTVVDAVGG